MKQVVALTVLLLVVVVVPAHSQGNEVIYDEIESGDTASSRAPLASVPAMARVGKTGQTTCYDPTGGSATTVTCSGTGQDGDLQSGVAWPTPRFVDNDDGTVTDKLTGLIWLKNANCFGMRNWATALADANTLASGRCGLTDASASGDWRLPNVNELQSLIDYEYGSPAISDAAGTAQWTEGDAFSGVLPGGHWASMSYANGPRYAWYVDPGYGDVVGDPKSASHYVWPVRGGRK